MKSRIFVLLILVVFLSPALLIADDFDEAYFGFLKATYNKHDKKLYDFLEEELDSYLDQFPGSPHRAEVFYYQAQVYAERGDEEQAFAMMMKLLFLHPNSPMHSKVIEEAYVLVAAAKSLKERADELKLVIDGTFPEDESQNRYYRYLEFLNELNLSRLYDFTLDEYYEFLELHSRDDRAMKIHCWIADILLKKGDETAADAAYFKYEQLFPESEELPVIRTKRADLLYRELKEYDQAIIILTELINNNPQTNYAAEALFLRAEIKAEKKKDYNGAIADYRQLVTDSPEHKKAIDALFHIAELNQDKLQASKTAIEVYNEIVDVYPDNIRGAEALEKSGDIYYKLKDLASAAEQYGRIAELYPSHKDAPEMLQKAAKIYESKLKDYSAAIGYYQQILDNYPESKLAADARKKILSLEEKLGEEH